MSTTQRRARLMIESLEKRLLLDGNALAEVPPLPGLPDPQGETCLQAPDPAPAAVLDEADVAAVARSINDFALDLYRELQGQQGNLFLSPFSISTALAMTYAGARGQTATQMADVLRFTLGQDALHPAFGSLIDDLNAAGQAGDYELSVANALWGQAGFPFHEAFVNLVQSSYGGGLEQVDFIADAEAARQTINQWVEGETHERIKDLIPPGVLNVLTRLVLTNAIYFKGQWTSEFDPDDTRDEPFTLASGEQVDARMMHQSGDFRYLESDGFQVLELPYVGDRLSMVVLLPSEAGPSGLDASLIPASLDAWLGGLSTREVIVSLPKFEMTTELQLNGPLEALGMTDAFSAVDADFSGMTDAEQLFIQAVLHKAFVQVNEEGTEAAAATVVVVGTESVPPPPVEFTADHPFHFLIRDTESGSVLFMGRLMEPVWEGEEGSATPTLTDQAEIRGSKWSDLDGDAVWDDDEAALENWTIYLDTNENGQLDEGEPWTLTGQDGSYALADLAPGTYTVAEVLQDGWRQTFPLPDVQLAPGCCYPPDMASDCSLGEVYPRAPQGGEYCIDIVVRGPCTGGCEVLSTYSVVGDQITIDLFASYHEAGTGLAWLSEWVRIPTLGPGTYSVSATLHEMWAPITTYDQLGADYLVGPPFGSPDYTPTWEATGTLTLKASTGRSVTLEAGQILEDVNFGNLWTGNLGPIDFVELAGLDPSAGEILCQIETTRAGYLTLEATYDPAGGTATLTLLDVDQQPIATSSSGTGSERIDHQAGGAGEVYFVKLEGTNSDVDLRLANLVWADFRGTQVTVHGTNANDTLEYHSNVTPEGLIGTIWRQVAINGLEYTFKVPVAPPPLFSLAFDGADGSDTALLYGDADNETILVCPGHGSLEGAHYAVTVTGVESINAYGGDGTNVAKLYDDAQGDETLVATPSHAELLGETFTHRVEGFGQVHAYSRGGTDVAKLYDDPATQDTLTATPGYSVLSNGRFFNRAVGFDYVHAYSRGGTDVAKLYDDPATQDTLTATPAYSVLSNGHFFSRAVGFGYVHAYSRGGADVAKLYDDPAGQDTFIAAPAYGNLLGSGFFNRALGFGYVHAYSAGGDDMAKLYDDPATQDTFVGTPDYSILTSSHFFNRAFGFDYVHGYSRGGGDLARLYDSPGDDHLEAKNRSARISYGDPWIDVLGFARVIAISLQGGTDTKHVEATDFVLETIGPSIDLP